MTSQTWGDALPVIAGLSLLLGVEATVVREIDRTNGTVRVTLRVEGREDFVKEWALGEMVTVVRGP